MPLSEKARIEVYLPDLPSVAYQELLDALELEFTYTFGGCTLIRGLSGSYQSQLGLPVQDRVNLLYTDTPFTFDEGFDRLSRYTDALRQTAFEALDEEAILVAASKSIIRPRRKRPDKALHPTFPLIGFAPSETSVVRSLQWREAVRLIAASPG